MDRETIRDKYNATIGYIETERSGVRVIRDSYNMKLGSYDPKDDKTRDASNQIVGTGDQLMRLLD